MRLLSTLLAAALIAAPAASLVVPATAFAEAPPETPAPETLTKMPTSPTVDKLIAIDTEQGEGPALQVGQQVLVHYTGWLYDPKAEGSRGAKFDSSVDRGTPFGLVVGTGMVIQGWDKGLIGMKKGGKRTLVIPPELGYGARGAGRVIPPNATLVFDVELVRIVQ